MTQTSTKSDKGTAAPVAAFSTFFQTIFKIHQDFGYELSAATNRVVAAAFIAKIPEDVMESAICEHEGLVGHAFNAARAQFNAVGDFARNQYAGMAQSELLPRSMLQCTQLNKALEKVETTAVQAVDKLEAARKKVVEPLGFPPIRNTKAA